MSKYNIILSLGRSGTLWMSELLDLQDNIKSVHERQQDDQLLHGLYSPLKLAKLDVKFWKKIVDSEIGNHDHYVDTDCRKRFHIQAFINDDDVNVACHVRHGVKVVSSYMDRNNTFKFPHWTSQAKPLNIDLDTWLDDMSRFERVCWAYRYGNEAILYHYGKPAKLEKINESYDYFCSNICSTLGIKVDKKYWEAKRKKPSHQGSYDMSRRYEEWSPEQQDQFDDICGPVMKELGYEY